MAAPGINQGDIVAMTMLPLPVASGLLGGLVQLQPPTFGKVDVANGTVSVLWQSGLLQASILKVSLDLIGAPDASEVTRLQGKFVQVNASGTATQSPEYQGVVVTLYTRNQAGADPATGTLALMKTNVGLYRELLSAGLFPVKGR